MEVKKFEVGKTYSTRSACDHECIFSFEVIKRTEKQLTLKHHNEVFKRGVYLYDGKDTLQAARLLFHVPDYQRITKQT